MCGIYGTIHFDTPPIDINTSIKARDCLAHRGPDDYGTILIDSQGKLPNQPFKHITELTTQSQTYNILLAHRRLSIIDISTAGHQPMMNHEQNLTITYNGEIYNYQALRHTLCQKGYQFHSQTDTEVILQAYLEWGVDCVKHFNGMFAFAIWDQRQQLLFCARDRFGKKPFYYYFASNHTSFSFASELTALTQSTTIPQTINIEALNGYLALGYILAPMTHYTDIHKLEAAHYLIIKPQQKTLSKHQYWHYENCFSQPTQDTPTQAAQTILELLSQAVKRRLIADVPVGAFLSGGLDSSAIAILAQQHHNQPLQTFSMGFQEDDYNELPTAQRLANWGKLLNHPGLCEYNPDLIDTAIQAFDEPFSDNSLIPMSAMSHFTAQQVKVILSGDGADEIFAGYPTYKASKIQHYFQHAPKALKQALLLLINRYSRNHSKKLSLEFKLKQFLYGALHAEDQAHYLWRIIFHPEERIKILGETYRELVYDTDPWQQYKHHYQTVRHLSALNRHLYVDAKTWLTDDILVKVDRTTMQYGLESRSPYLDVDLVSYVASLPASYKLSGFKEKQILKQALTTTLPDFVLHKKKAGFNAPVGLWLQSDHRQNEFRAFNQYVLQQKLTSSNINLSF